MRWAKRKIRERTGSLFIDKTMFKMKRRMLVFSLCVVCYWFHFFSISLFYSNAIFGCFFFFSSVSCIAFADVVGKVFFCVIFGGFKNIAGSSAFRLFFQFVVIFYDTKKRNFRAETTLCEWLRGENRKTNWYVYKLEWKVIMRWWLCSN